MKPFLVISQLFYAVCLVGWLVVWMMSFMLFDSGIFFWNSFMFVLISLFPVAVVVCSILSWIFHKRRRRAAVILNLIPMIWVVAFGAIMLLY